MLDELETESEYMAFDYNNHKVAYSVQSSMYRQLLNAFAIAIAVKEGVGDEWRPQFDEEWESRSKELEQAFDLA